MDKKDTLLERVLAGKEHLLFDGAMGTALQAKDTGGVDLPDFLCLTHPDIVTAVHQAYVDAGAEALTTNTFGANASALGQRATVHELYEAAVACARAARPHYVFGDIGPGREFLAPLGTLTPEAAYDQFFEQAQAAYDAGVDGIIIETMTDLTLATIATQAATDHVEVPVFVTMTFDAHGHTLFGSTPEEAAVELEAAGAHAVGINCSVGPHDMRPHIQAMLSATKRPVIAQANAGMPQRTAAGTIEYSVGVEEYVQEVQAILEDGAHIVGGCCGTTPEYIAGLARVLRAR